MYAYECDTPEQKKVCTDLLNQTEKEIKDLADKLQSTKNQGASLARDKAILDLQIKQAQLKIKAQEISIANIGKDIVVKSNNIQKLDGKIEEAHTSLSQIIRKTKQLEDYSLVTVFLNNISLSDAFADLDSFDSIHESMQDTFNELRDAKQANELEKESLNKKKNTEIDTKMSIEEQKKKVERDNAEKKRLLALNQNDQSNYQKVIANKSAAAAQIRAALFKLRDAEAIPFGTALTYAKTVSASTGIRPAFLLAIITQESNLGANVGSCYLTDTETGAGVRVATGAAVLNVMKPTRDVAPFIEITKDVGRDYTKTRVSCPFSYGYGGAMGPAQFIPSTWQLIKGRITKSLGVAAADPWNPQHAFMASGFYLSDLGASVGSYTAERNAACRYYSGKVCGAVSTNTFYGDQVMAKATSIQANIDILDN